MKRFNISIDNHDNQPSQNSSRGVIQIGDYIEKFEPDLSFWKPSDYINHWGKSIFRIVNGKNKSCLITSVSNPETSNFLFWWPLYRVGNLVFIQNEILFFDEIDKTIDIENPYCFITDRETISEEGSPISEWEIEIDSFTHFLSEDI